VLPVSASLASAATETVRRLDERLAAGPISWGVCEVPDWGVQLPAATVLAEMRALGFRATDFGPNGGWYVLEQDTALVSAEATTGGTADNVRRSIDYLRAVIEAARATTPTPKEGSE
jgi:hypothetical protein